MIYVLHFVCNHYIFTTIILYTMHIILYYTIAYYKGSPAPPRDVAKAIIIINTIVLQYTIMIIILKIIIIIVRYNCYYH